MRSRSKFVCLLICLLGLIKLGEAVKCYSCSSAQNRLCGDYFNRRIFGAYECLGSCIKTRGRDLNNQVEINRFCSTLRDDTCYNSVYNLINVNMCSCNTDFCNPASKLLPTCHILIVSFLSFLIVSCLLF